MNHVPTLEEAKDYIYSLDFDQIIEKMVYSGWPRQQVIKMCEFYRNFLFLNKKYEQKCGSLPPSEEIDEFWHNHILDTQRYGKDCQMIFGYFFHHYPYFGLDGKSNQQDLVNAYENTQQLHFKEFGSFIPRIKKLRFRQIIKILWVEFMGSHEAKLTKIHQTT